MTLLTLTDHGQNRGRHHIDKDLEIHDAAVRRWGGQREVVPLLAIEFYLCLKKCQGQGENYLLFSYLLLDTFTIIIIIKIITCVCVFVPLCPSRQKILQTFVHECVCLCLVNAHLEYISQLFPAVSGCSPLSSPPPRVLLPPLLMASIYTLTQLILQARFRSKVLGNLQGGTN